MHWLINFGYTAASFVVIISVIVFVHEFGHYIVAKLCGVRIEAFSIGFGREIFGWNDRSGTRWKVCMLPFGGYVRMFGDASAASTPEETIEALSPEEKKYTFHFKPLWQKALVVIAGPAANFLLTIAILTGFILTIGLPSTEPVVGEILASSPASDAGLQPGDRVLRVGKEKVETFNDIPRLLSTNLGTPVTLILDRKGEERHVTLTPRWMEDEDALGNKVRRPLIGIKSKQTTYENVTLPRALWEGTKRTYAFCETTLTAVGQMVSGKRHPKELKGPVGIAKFSGQAAEKGLQTVLWFIAMLSANLGLINLFPIPLLDGGHLTFYLIEALQGKPLAHRFQEYGFKIGFVLLAALMAFTFLNDLIQLF